MSTSTSLTCASALEEHSVVLIFVFDALEKDIGDSFPCQDRSPLHTRIFSLAVPLRLTHREAISKGLVGLPIEALWVSPACLRLLAQRLFPCCYPISFGCSCPRLPFFALHLLTITPSTRFLFLLRHRRLQASRCHHEPVVDLGRFQARAIRSCHRRRDQVRQGEGWFDR